MRIIFVIVLFVTISLQSCEELANQRMPDDIVFFDLKKFISAEIIRLNSVNPTIEKTTKINGVAETKTLQLNNFNKELKIFQEADINKLAWGDKYLADSTFVGNQLTAIHYQAKEEQLTTRDLKVLFENSVVSKIELSTSATSIVTDVEKQMIYEPNVRYHIVSKQKTSGSDANIVEIIGAFK